MVEDEDTPEGGPEELQWKIDRLIEQVERHTAELERERRSHGETKKKWAEDCERIERLTGRLTIGDLRKAGFTVKIDEAGFCETCSEEY